ncbi:MAG: mandelate racemase/muconate lactonizing enzyme family protein [Candidatus Bathyarchaeota archaeon]|nr:MAG: mandelate racemase/muconate lactonizing enzyme family protein [Candidatus Bathyarchaeota archaeon]
MKITDVRIVSSKKPIVLPEPWKPAMSRPSAEPRRTTRFDYFEICTDEDITGIGPSYSLSSLPPSYLEFVKEAVVGSDPFHVEYFWENYMSGRWDVPGSLGGVDTALWDLVGKALGVPVCKLLGVYHDRIPAYAATYQLHSPEEHAKETVEFRDQGIRAIKLRLHRQNHEDDLKVVEAVRDAVGDDMDVMVDANQNNLAPGYNYWSRRTAMWMARKLDALDVFFFEDPLPLSDVAGIKQLVDAVDMPISGGEHSRHIYEFRDLLFNEVFDIVQPDLIMGSPGVGMTGMGKVARMAQSVGRLVVPHVYPGAICGLNLAATLQVLASVSNSPYVEYPLEPPALTVENQHGILKEPILIEKDGCIRIPQQPGIGVEIDEEFVKRYL